MTKFFRYDNLKIFCCVAASFAIAFGANGQDLDPRNYANLPVGLNFLIAGYGHTEGGVGTDSALPIDNVHVEIHSGVLAYARSLDVFGKSAKVDVGKLIIFSESIKSDPIDFLLILI